MPQVAYIVCEFFFTNPQQSPSEKGVDKRSAHSRTVYMVTWTLAPLRIIDKIQSPQSSQPQRRAIMSLPQRCARQLLREPFQRGSLPIFLAPAFSQPRSQCFSTTSPAQSRVGGAPITIPPEVSFKLVDIPETLTRTRGKDIPKFAAEIKGPRGRWC